MTALRFLDLGDTPVADVSALRGLTALREVDLRGTKVTDVSALAALSGMRDYHGDQPATPAAVT